MSPLPLEEVPICELTAVVLLAVASFYDIRDRSVPDWPWILGSILGLIMKLLDYEETIKFLLRAWPFLLILGIMFVMEWLLSLSGQADVLAYLTLAILLTGNRMFPDALLVYLLSKVFIVLIIPFQFLINIVRISRDRELIEGFDEPLWRKLLALAVLSPYDRRLAECSSVAEVTIGGRRKFVLRAALKLSCGDPPEEGRWIAPSYPAIPFILAATLIVTLTDLLA